MSERREPVISPADFTGHIVVLNLLKRIALQGGRSPEQVERFIAGMPLEEIDARVPLVESGAKDEHGKPIRYREKIWDPSWQSRGKLGDVFSGACQIATGKPIRLHAAKKRDLWETAKYLVAEIDKNGPPHDLLHWYPEGWRAAYDLVKEHVARARAARIEPAANDIDPDGPETDVGF